jgi:hypothetical protein
MIVPGRWSWVMEVSGSNAAVIAGSYLLSKAASLCLKAFMLPGGRSCLSIPPFVLSQVAGFIFP